MQSRGWGLAVVLVLMFATLGFAQPAELLRSIDERHEATWKIARAIWSFAEPGYQEKQSAKLLADTLEQAGFTVERGVAEIPTAFVASYGTGQPMIGILAEYDALPGLSQQAIAEQLPVEGNTYGHACGHHLFGAASLSAAIAIGEQMKAGKLKGTIRYYGCPAEEGGSGKAFMVRAGLFRDCAAVLHWHPSNRNAAGDSSCLARIAVKFRFKGISAHASGAPEQGRSALDAVALTNHAAELLREHTPDFTRIHHIITAGGGAPNVVPDFAEVYYYVRHPQADVVRSLYPRLLKCAEAGALATETKLEVIDLGGTVEMLPNETLAKVVHQQLEKLNTIKYDAAELEFAQRIQQTLSKPAALDSVSKIFDVSHEISKGSTDVADVSWVVPTAGFSTACWVPGTPAHSWQATAAGGTTIGKQGMQLAAKTLATSAWELFTQPDHIAKASAEFQKRRGERQYQPLLLPNQKPPLDYRNAPSSGD